MTPQETLAEVLESLATISGALAELARDPIGNAAQIKRAAELLKDVRQTDLNE